MLLQLGLLFQKLCATLPTLPPVWSRNPTSRGRPVPQNGRSEFSSRPACAAGPFRDSSIERSWKQRFKNPSFESPRHTDTPWDWHIIFTYMLHTLTPSPPPPALGSSFMDWGPRWTGHRRWTSFVTPVPESGLDEWLIRWGSM